MSEIKVDNLTGKTSAGNITVTSEGGAATMQLQQGLAKAWVHFEGDAATVSVLDGINHASISDLGSGRYSVTFTNSFGNATYASNVTGSTQRTGTNDTNSHATSGITYEIVNENGAFTDCKQGQAVVLGDLA